MKTLKEKLKQILNRTTEDNIILDKNYIVPINISFENFCLENKLEESEDNYKIYINVCLKDYDSYLKQVWENLFRSYPVEDLVNKLKEQYNIYNISKVNNRSICQFSFVAGSDNILDDDKFYELLNFYNYYVRSYEYINNEFNITLEPYKPEDVTNYIYNDCNGIIYHVTSPELFEKIKSSEIKPKGKYVLTNTQYQYRQKRAYFIANPNINEVKINLKQIKNTNLSLRNNYIYLKIDLNKYRNRINFKVDSSASGYNAYFTNEPIPGYCVEDITKEL